MTDLALALALHELACQAGAVIREYYLRERLEITRKSDDSPVTAADFASQEILLAGLDRLLPGVPVISEELPSPPLAERREWHSYWLVDPLDGTREFLDKTGEFAINIALVTHHRPVFGLIHAPCTGASWVGGQGIPAQMWQRDDRTPLGTSPLQKPARIITSRRQTGKRMRTLLGHMESTLGPMEHQWLGSALKFTRIAAGSADAYPRYADTGEWDTAAGQALLEAAGGAVLGLDGLPLRYNCRERLINPSFIAVGDGRQPWHKWLAIAE